MSGLLMAAKTKRNKRPQQVRRVVLQRQAEGATAGAWEEQRIRSSLGGAKLHPVARLTDEGVEYGRMPQPGDEIAYGMDPYRLDDCFQAAIATATQTPIEQVPDPGIRRRVDRGENPEGIIRDTWERVEAWAAKRGLSVLLWEELPVDHRRWIGVVESPDSLLAFGNHCLVMAYDRLLFDPSCSVRPPPGYGVMRFDQSQVAYGLSFDNEEIARCLFPQHYSSAAPSPGATTAASRY